jgi:hypothetical protein
VCWLLHTVKMPWCAVITLDACRGIVLLVVSRATVPDRMQLAKHVAPHVVWPPQGVLYGKSSIIIIIILHSCYRGLGVLQAHGADEQLPPCKVVSLGNTSKTPATT